MCISFSQIVSILLYIQEVIKYLFNVDAKGAVIEYFKSHLYLLCLNKSLNMEK